MKRSLGFSIIEILIVLLIAGIGASLFFAGITGMRDKQDLSESVAAIENVIKRAQSYAQQFSLSATASLTPPICIKISSSPKAFQAYYNQNANTLCGDSGDSQISSDALLKHEVELATCTGNITNSCIIWISPLGDPLICPSSGSCGTTLPAACELHDFEIILSNPNLELKSRAREIEFLQTRLVHLPMKGEKGRVETLWAKSEANGLDVGAGACE